MTKPAETANQRALRQALEWLTADPRGHLLLSLWCRSLFDPPASRPDDVLYEAGRRALAHEIWSSIVTASPRSLAFVLAHLYRERRRDRAGDDPFRDDGPDGGSDDGGQPG